MVGLAAHVGGYLLKSSVTTEPLGLLADLFYALGYTLWTGVVVVVFVQLYPETKRRHFKQALDAYEAAQREKAQAGSNQASGDDQAPTARSGQADPPAGCCDTSGAVAAAACPAQMMASNGARPAVDRPPWGPLPVEGHDRRHLSQGVRDADVMPPAWEAALSRQL